MYMYIFQSNYYTDRSSGRADFDKIIVYMYLDNATDITNFRFRLLENFDN